MEQAKTNQPTIGTWARLASEEIDRSPKVNFEVNIPVLVTFLEDEPREYQGDTGAYYVFDVLENKTKQASKNTV